MGTGPLHRPKLPGIPGIETFAGHSLPHQPVGLRLHRRRPGRRADGPSWPTSGSGIIGTGATAVQCIPHLARDAGELFVFQRTPSSIDVRNNHAIDPEWFATLGPGWQQRVADQLRHAADRRLRRRGPGQGRLDRHRPAHPGPRGQRDHASPAPSSTPETDRQRPIERQRRREDGGDPGPGRRRSCRTRPRPRRSSPGTASCASGRASTTSTCRPTTSPTCHLVDTDGKGVERIDETGVWVGGVHYELDCLIFASGFEVGTDYARRSGYETVGRDGRHALGALGRRDAEPARHPRARLPEPVHHRAEPGRPT